MLLQKRSILKSEKFGWFFTISALRSCVPYYFSVNIKYVGLSFLSDDDFISQILFWSVVLSFFLRMFFGHIVRKVNFFNTCLVMGAASLLCSGLILGVSLTGSRSLFVGFSLIQFWVASMAFNLNFVSYYEVFTKEIAIHLLQVFDFQVILGMGLNSVLNSYLSHIAEMRVLFAAFIVIDLLAIIGIKWFERKYFSV